MGASDIFSDTHTNGSMDSWHHVGLHNVQNENKARRDLSDLECDSVDFIFEHFTDHCVVLLPVSTLGGEQHDHNIRQRII